MENLRTNHQLHAIRMNWLRWLATPIIAVWNYIASAFCWAWGTVKIGWNGAKSSLDSNYWKVGTIGIAIGVYGLFLFIFMAIKLEVEFIMYPGFIVAFLAYFWTMGAVTGLFKYKKENGSFPEGGVKSLLGNGMATMKFVLLSIAVIILAILFVAILALFGMIPGVGPILLGLFSLPMVLASAVIILITVMLWLGGPFVAAHTLHGQDGGGTFIGNYRQTCKSLIKIGAVKFIDWTIAVLPAFIIAYLVAILPGLLSWSSIFTSIGITAVVADMTDAMSFQYLQSMNGFTGSLGIIFAAVTASLLIGFVNSFVFSAIWGAAYEVYGDSREVSIFKKIVGLFALVASPFVAFAVISALFGMIGMFLF